MNEGQSHAELQSQREQKLRAFSGVIFRLVV